tara:strand:+ start:3655 stop:3768 length:114 start_codon:yes stop_codon:yes gene_type:complete
MHELGLKSSVSMVAFLSNIQFNGLKNPRFIDKMGDET